MKKNILFLCTGNSCRSQMAEALAKQLLGDDVAFYSAGIVAHGMNPNVEKVLAELGVSLEGHYSKTIEDIGINKFDCVVTVCDNAAESCPVLGEYTKLIHQPFPDPPKLAENSDSEESKLDCYRQVRDQIKQWLIDSAKQFKTLDAA